MSDPLFKRIYIGAVELKNQLYMPAIEGENLCLIPCLKGFLSVQLN
jgi:hypothetical protein